MQRADDLAELLRPPVGSTESDSDELRQLLNPSGPPVPPGLGWDDSVDEATAA